MPISASAQAVLDSAPEKVFDNLTQLVCRLLKVPVALVTILPVCYAGIPECFDLPGGDRMQWLHRCKSQISEK